jgi:hypothetical protein
VRQPRRRKETAAALPAHEDSAAAERYGGRIPSGQWGIVGERGPELAFGGAMGANIVPAAATALTRAPSSVSNSRVTHNNVSVALHSPDAQSFMRNQGQVAAVLARAVAMGSRNL